MKRFRIRLERDEPLGVVDATVRATYEGARDGWKVWGAKNETGNTLFLSREERARAEAAVAELARAEGAAGLKGVQS